MARAKPPKPVCLCGECGGVPTRRGLSVACYTTAARAVKKGTTTWAKLIKAGLALEAMPRQQRRRSPMGRKIEALTSRAG